MIPRARRVLDPVPGGGSNIGLVSPGRLQGGRQLTRSLFRVQPRVGVFSRVPLMLPRLRGSLPNPVSSGRGLKGRAGVLRGVRSARFFGR